VQNQSVHAFKGHFGVQQLLRLHLMLTTTDANDTAHIVESAGNVSSDHNGASEHQAEYKTFSITSNPLHRLFSTPSGSKSCNSSYILVW